MSLRFKSKHSDSAVHVVCSLSHVWLFATPWTVAGQAPLSMGFLRREYWYGLACPPPGDLSNPGIELVSPALAGIFFFLNHWAIREALCSSHSSYKPGILPLNAAVQNLGRNRGRRDGSTSLHYPFWFPEASRNITVLPKESDPPTGE